ncbi:MAG: sugar phosphate isomerase/epimerase family protein [Tunicatimonas sp.]|uniref:sugar phosphate isomerase/epimerase family protein n=1 Tax=Tunicatimonas sp. TaxID=1940096 RepID=UPI003C76D6C1
MNRRHFLHQSTLAAATLASTSFTSSALASPQPKARKFTMSLDPGAIGVKVDQNQLIEYATKFGFEAVTPYPDFLAKLTKDEVSDLLDEMQQKKVVWGVAGLPVEFRKDENTLREGLKKLPALAKGLQQANVTRVSTWVMPTHAELNYLKNFRQHADRLREVATILADHNLRFGLEYVGPTTLRNAKKYAFVHTLEETQALIEEIGQKNVGVVLDSFHWFTAEEDVKDILTLSNEDIVAADLNDAHAGRTAVEQIDGQRELPMATGLIDTQAFLNTLVTIGFDGPVRAEPFNQALRDMPDDKAVASTAKAMKKAFSLIS